MSAWLVEILNMDDGGKYLFTDDGNYWQIDEADRGTVQGWRHGDKLKVSHGEDGRSFACHVMHVCTEDAVLAMPLSYVPAVFDDGV